MSEPEEVGLAVYGLIFKLLILCFFSLEGVTYSQVEERVRPYLLPVNSPVRPFLDSLFSEKHILLSTDSLLNAGFTKAKPRRFTNLIVTTHALLPGYVFKLYLEAQKYHKNMPEYEIWILRILGAQKTQIEINKRGYGGLMKVPNKWIYLLPKKSVSSKDYYPRYTILVENDMELLSDEENLTVWKSSLVTPNLLLAVYDILSTVGLADCARYHNIPFAEDGRIAFIDTQTWGEKVNYEPLGGFLSKINREFWESLTD